MSEMISVASGFQYSVNIGYDLNNNEKLKNFIPTQSALRLLGEILLSTAPTSTERSRILIGAYGKGKSHIVLMILSMLLKRDRSLFEKTMPKIEEDPRLEQIVENYYEGKDNILPVVITGSNTSLTQAFLLALQRTLSDNGLLGIMPETNYRAAVAVIHRWQDEFPETFQTFESSIDKPVSAFIEDLLNFDITAYEQFERIYPSLTAGSAFNPFLGFDVVELYESVAKSLQEYGYTGLYVVYDEFSKYLEANITEASLSDTKMLQDFAEKCNRSGSTQLHLMLISHKEIANYIDKLPKQKVDGWRGVSERFRHIHLNNNFSQTYEIIASVIQKQPELWKAFIQRHKSDFENLLLRYKDHPLFSEHEDELQTAILGCYPLHPVSTFILPRLSERVAQNERTLFTFLSADGSSTLKSFVDDNTDEQFRLITPDAIYDYFEPLFRKEAYGSETHENYILSTTILSKLPADSLEAKIVKTISLIYVLAQFERLKPTKDEIVGIFETSYTVSEITTAIDNLIEKEFVVYLKRSNNYLRLKQTSGVDIRSKIKDYVEANRHKASVKQILNASNFDNYMYPARYNDDREMTRYFAFVFVDESEIAKDTNWVIKSENIAADGVIFAVISHSEESLKELQETVRETSTGCPRQIFIVPKRFFEIDSVVHEFEAVCALREASADDPVLFAEYDAVYEDLREVISSFLASYTHPEKFKANYYFDGQKKEIHRKAELTELMSNICDSVFSMTPVISNEAVNRDEITSIASNSRNKIITGLLRNELEKNLGLSGSGQEVSIMRSTLIRTGIWDDTAEQPRINLRPQNPQIANMLSTIEQFIVSARRNGSIGFDVLYDMLTLPEYHIGLRKGLIPIYLAAVIHEYKQQVIIVDKYGQVPISADVLLQINADPKSFTLSFVDWDPEKEEFVASLSEIFNDYVIEAEKATNSYDYVVNAMKRWMMDLPKYAKESKLLPSGKKINPRYIAMLKLLRQNSNSYSLLFEKLPKAFGYESHFSAGLGENIGAAKLCYDRMIDRLRQSLSAKTKILFTIPQNRDNEARMSLASTIRDWCETIDQGAFDHLFPDGTEKCLALFKTITNDENTFMVRLAKTVTGLRLEDWDSETSDLFINRLSQFKNTAESYHSVEDQQNDAAETNYKVTFINQDGSVSTKSFERVETGRRGKLLHNQIVHSLEAMGQAISEQEKRQVLIDILHELC